MLLSLVRMAQALFTQRLLLRMRLFFNPSPPKCLGLVTTSPLIACNFFLVIESPHRKLQLIPLSLVQIFEGRRLHCIKWVGMDEVTKLMRVIWLARERDLVF